MTDLTLLTVAEASKAIAAQELDPVDLAAAYLDRIARHNPAINAYVAVTAERAQADARVARDEIATGKHRGPLHGIPLGLKDLVDTAGIETAGGAQVLRGRVPAQDATVARRLREAGTVLLGKTNTHELAFGATTNNPHFGATRNPWNTDLVPGGSSGGSGAAIASRMAALTIGTDTGGSIRVPASLCGCVGFKPTYGRVSKRGILPMSWLVDHPGPIVKCVEDAALMLQAIAGYDAGDYATVPMPVPDYRAALQGGVRGMKAGIPPAFFATSAPGVRAAVDTAVKWFEREGVELVEVDLDTNAFSEAFAVVVAESREAVEELWQTRREEFGPDLQQIFSTPLPDAIGFARQLRAVYSIGEHFRQVMETVDFVLAPTTPITAVPVGQETLDLGGSTVLTTNVLASLTAPFNIARLPVLSLPCGFTDDGLPVGLSIAGRPFAEETVLRAGYAYEQSAGWYGRWPEL